MIIGVDTGGTKTLVGVFTDKGALKDTRKFQTPKSLANYFTDLQQTITELCKPSDITAICIALPGRIEDGHTLIYAQNIGWQRNINFKALLEDTFKCPVYVENDANLAGLAEIRSLAKLPKIGLYVTVSTGIGTGLIIDGQLQPVWSQSEGGQIILEHDGIMRTWESFASGKAIYERYKKYGSEIKSKRIWHQIATDISKGIVALAPAMRPEVIVIGGSMGTHFASYEADLVGIIKEQLKEQFIPVIRKASHPEEAVLYGCYHHATDPHTHQ